MTNKLTSVNIINVKGRGREAGRQKLKGKPLLDERRVPREARGTNRPRKGSPVRTSGLVMVGVEIKGEGA